MAKEVGLGKGERKKESSRFMELIIRGFSRRAVRGRRWSGFGGLIKVILGLLVGVDLSRRNEGE
jgi:hypothetical protein